MTDAIFKDKNKYFPNNFVLINFNTIARLKKN